ncbi:hypothetical protein D3C71_24360 [compost metagenome]
MDVPQLKLLAGRIRALLQEAEIPVSYNQALDLSGALAGVRNWPEVQAFPTRLAASHLDLQAATRLSNRLQRQFGLAREAQELLQALRPPGAADEVAAHTHIWPAGPRPGVYITTEQTHIDALLARYDEATDGELVYAEDAASRWHSAIDLGEHGLWSSGMQRVASGTLVVLGPLDLNQQSWESVGQRLEYACLDADLHGHRVAVLLQTQTPQTLHHDVDLLVRERQPDGADNCPMLLGDVTADGELAPRQPFAPPSPAPTWPSREAATGTFPQPALPHLQRALQRRSTGIILLGSPAGGDNWAGDLVDALLPLTDFAGPAARIRPRDRSTPAKDWDVPPGIAQLPFLPSVQAAYSLGYRRMVVHPAYTSEEVIERYADDVLFIGAAYGGLVDEVYLSGNRLSRYENLAAGLDYVVAILAVTPLKTPKVDTALLDMFVPAGPLAPTEDVFEAVQNILVEDRCLRADEQLTALLEQGVTPAEVRQAIPRGKWVGQLLDEVAKARRRAKPTLAKP